MLFDTGSVRRKDRILDETSALLLLQVAEFGYLSLGVGTDGYAYGVPINFVYDQQSQAIYFHCATEGHKLDCLKLNNKVSFCIIGKTNVIAGKFTSRYESLIAFGTADLHLPADEKLFALRLLIQKYSPDFIATGDKYIQSAFDRVFVFKLSVERITAKANK
jgi:nitroimidazol reductase NimA-like FMN-containing flavoprotein (pyridoxamine 5'-phosphate oxidase superfamily)